MSRRTRQRQGRDFAPFSILEYLNRSRKAAYDEKESSYQTVVEGQRKKSILESLERFKHETEINAEPVDGREPPDRGLI